MNHTTPNPHPIQMCSPENKLVIKEDTDYQADDQGGWEITKSDGLGHIHQLVPKLEFVETFIGRQLQPLFLRHHQSSSSVSSDVGLEITKTDVNIVHMINGVNNIARLNKYKGMHSMRTGVIFRASSRHGLGIIVTCCQIQEWDICLNWGSLQIGSGEHWQYTTFQQDAQHCEA